MSQTRAPFMTVRIEFDGGNGCNNPVKGYGEGYGSFCFGIAPIWEFEMGEPKRVKHGRPMSNNAAELWTLVSAVEMLRIEWRPSEINLLICGDSQISLSWAKRASVGDQKRPSKGSSEEMILAISHLRKILPHFRSVTCEWQPRAKSVRTFGH